MGACLPRGMGLLTGLSGFAVSILELAANSASSRMFQAPNLHLAMQLLNWLHIKNMNAIKFVNIDFKENWYQSLSSS